MAVAGRAASEIDPGRSPVLRRLASSVGLSAGALVVVLLVIEIFFRIAAPRDNIPQREYDPHLGWRGRPNLKCVLNERLFTISISQNSRGFRDSERSLSKAPGTVRILCCGDSFTWGWAVEQDEIYTAVLEQRCGDAHQDVEVLNAGVGGYSTDQLLLYLVREGFSYSPDYVVYQAAWNDVRDNPRTVVEAIYNKPTFDLEGDGSLVLRGSPVPPLGAAGTLKYFVSRHSRLAYFLKHRLHLARFAAPTDDDPAADSPPTADSPTTALPEEIGYPFRLFCRLVAEMDAACRKRGVGFVVLIDFAVTDEELEHWETVCRNVDVRFVADYLVAREEAAGVPAYVPLDGHWTADGHRWIADLLYEDVLDLLSIGHRDPGRSTAPAFPSRPKASSSPHRGTVSQGSPNAR